MKCHTVVFTKVCVMLINHQKWWWQCLSIWLIGQSAKSYQRPSIISVIKQHLVSKHHLLEFDYFDKHMMYSSNPAHPVRIPTVTTTCSLYIIPLTDNMISLDSPFFPKQHRKTPHRRKVVSFTWSSKGPVNHQTIWITADSHRRHKATVTVWYFSLSEPPIP